MIRLTIPSIDSEDIRNVQEVLASGYLVQGARVKSFEQAAATYVNRRFAVAVSSGTAALHLALLALWGTAWRHSPCKRILLHCNCQCSGTLWSKTGLYRYRGRYI